MSNPLVIRVTRPYASTDEFLANEAWTLQSKAILLVGEPERPAGTLVRFEVVLETGEKVMRGEGTAGRYVPSMGQRPGGLEVRFKRLDAATKALIDRALRARPRKRSSESTASLAAVELSPLPHTAVSDAAASETPPSDRALPLITPPPSVAGAAVELNLAVLEPAAAVSEGDAAASPQPPTERPPNSRSGTRRRVIKEVAAPPNRDSLLERLRERARALRKG